MKKHSKYFLYFTLVIISSCGISNTDVVGKYCFEGQNTKDSLILKNDVYIHKIYNNSLKLVYSNSNKWSMDSDRITLFDFFNNEDNNLPSFISTEKAKKFLMISSFPIYNEQKKVIIEVNADEGFFYKKRK